MVSGRPHVFGVCQQVLRDDDIDDWPARSPDLNLIQAPLGPDVSYVSTAAVSFHTLSRV